MKERFGPLGYVGAPMLVAGHSMGEFTALVAAGVLDFEDALRLVRERHEGERTQYAGESRWRNRAVWSAHGRRVRYHS